MKISVWDTYVEKKDGEIMHFDIIVPDTVTDDALVQEMGRKYLASVGQEGQTLTSEQCRYCHQEIASLEMLTDIEQKGFYIIEMEGCKS